MGDSVALFAIYQMPDKKMKWRSEKGARPTFFMKGNNLSTFNSAFALECLKDLEFVYQFV
jgi:hypothetical protein